MAAGFNGLLELTGVWLRKPPVSSGATLLLTYLVDWDDDQNFDEAYEDITEYVKSGNWEIGMDQAYQSVGGDTSLTLQLNNLNREFSPENAESPFYGQIEPQRRVKVLSLFDGTERTMYLGYLNDIQPEGGDGRTAVLKAAGPQQYLDTQQVRMSLLENVRSDQVIEAILGRMQMPAALDSDIWVLGVAGHSELGETTVLSDISVAAELDVGLTTFPYVSDTWDPDFHGNQYVGETWASGFNGMDAIVDVVRAERGRFFFNRQGKAVFWSRGRLQTNGTLAATFDNEVAGPPDYSYGADLANRVRVKVYPRAVSVSSDSQLWQLVDPITISSKDQHSLSVRYSDDETGMGIAGQDAYIDQASVVHDGVAITFATEFESRGAKITINNDDNRDVMLSGLSVKGKKLTTYNEVEVVVDDATTLIQRGIREYSIDSKLMSDVLFAESLAEYELNRRKTPRGQIGSIKIRADTVQRTEQVISRTIGDRIRVIDDQLNHDAEYFIIGEHHNHGLREVYYVEWRLEPAEASQYWLLGIDGYSELGETTGLAL